MAARRAPGKSYEAVKTAPAAAVTPCDQTPLQYHLTVTERMGVHVINRGPAMQRPGWRSP
jgi:hypothetical protein